MHPDVTNFEFLASMYGSIDGSIPAGSNMSSSGSVNRQLLQPPQQEEEEAADLLLRKTSKKEKTPDWVLKSVQSIHEQLSHRRRFLLRGGQQQQQPAAQSSNGILSGGGAGGVTHHINVGEGYSVVIHMLHANTAAVTVP